MRTFQVTYLIRNLATLTRVGLLAPGSDATQLVLDQLGDEARLRAARVHPIAVLAAMKTYAQGRGVRGHNTWEPVTQVIDALDGAFYATFQNVEPTGKRWLLALDVSGSMGGGVVAGVPGLTPRIATGAMALVTAARERQHTVVAFCSPSGGGYGGQFGGGDASIAPVPISPRQRLDDVLALTDKIPMGGTDCSLPMRWALKQKLKFDVFVVYTDNETWFGDVHPAQALRQYREKMGIPARLVIVSMIANPFSIADPADAGMLDVVGFDTATPAIMSDFVRG